MSWSEALYGAADDVAKIQVFCGHPKLAQEALALYLVVALQRGGRKDEHPRGATRRVRCAAEVGIVREVDVCTDDEEGEINEQPARTVA